MKKLTRKQAEIVYEIHKRCEPVWFWQADPRAVKIQDDWNEMVIAEAATVRPRVKKWDIERARETLGEQRFQELYDEGAEKGKRYFELKKKVEKRTWQILFEYAGYHKFEYLDEKQKTRSSCSSDFSTQTSSHYYARNSLMGDVAVLREKGYDVEIVDQPWVEVNGIKTSIVTYYLMANCSMFDFFMAKMSSSMTLLDWGVMCWQNGVNPSAINPFYPQSLHEESMRIYQSRDKIIKEKV